VGFGAWARPTTAGAAVLPFFSTVSFRLRCLLVNYSQ
jgi:hypothetical protein